MLLHQQIELQAAHTPDAVAVRYAGKALTYAELDRHANRCARYLRELGVGPDVIVGLLMERSLEMMVALLGILKAGGAYLPLDPGYPQARLAFVLDDAGVPVVITEPGLDGKLGQFGGTVLALELGNDVLAGYDGAALDGVNQPDDLAYVIYTSGSTGQPKGCMLTHRAIVNRLDWMQDMYRLDGRDLVLQKTPYTFDVSVWEFFWPLLAGATLVLAKPQGHKDSHYLTKLIRQEGVTVCHFVPSMLRFFLDDPQAPQCTSLRHVFTSGEALPFELVRRFKELLPARLHNLYGPTEAAVDVSYWECEIRPDQVVPIGRAISNIALHVLDEARRPVARGQEGELHIAGVGLARGYLNRPELTAERFVPNPFGEPGSRMYRTGDRVRELEDGNIEFLGRVDFQVKLRGLRIELGEVEATLRAFPGVGEAVVLVRGEADGDPKLVAYLASAGAAPDFRAVRDFVRRQLPEYMVPSVVAVLERLPVTTHGKLDRDALPWPVASGAQSAGEGAGPAAAAPAQDGAADVGRRIAGFLADLLKCAAVAEQADLFDLGATSLTLVRLAEWLRQEYGVDVPVEQFLDAPTVQAIAAYVARAGGVARQGGAVAPAVAVDAAGLAGRIREFIGTVLLCDGLTDDADLFDLGATSLSLIRVAEWIRQEYGIEVPVDVFLDAPSVRGIVGHLIGKGVVEAAPPSRAEAAAAAAPPPIAGQTIALPTAGIRATAYLPPLPQRFAAKPVDFAAFGAWMMLLAAQEKDGRLCYLHPSGGGLNAVRTYVAVKPEAVSGLAGGVYYFHPVAHALYRVGDVAGLSRTAFGAGDRTAFDSAALAVFFVAALDAIVPVYREHTGTLVSVEAGYMGQLLLSRQGAYALAARPVGRVDCTGLQAAFGLADSERVVHCLLAGAAPAGMAGEPAEIGRDWAPATGGAMLSHRALREAAAQAPLSKEAMDLLHDERRHLRDVSGLTVARRLDAGVFTWDDYRLRACQRAYESAALPLQALGGLLTLCRPRPDGGGACLFGSPAARSGWQLYLYVRAGRVEGLAEGSYRYDEASHALLRCGDLADAAMAQGYSPYNRKHYKNAAFCLFMVARPAAGRNGDEGEALHLPLLEAGYLGQLLMEAQAEFGLGLCPIGGMRFELVRASMQLGEDAQLLHSFTGGMFHQEIPAGRRRLLEPAGTAPVRQERAGALAIVGLSGRYPGAEGLDAYWDNLQAGVSSVAPMPAARRALLARDEAPAIRAGGYLAQIDRFDSLLFGISPVEARALDPQERLLLESVWACLEDAGYTAESLLRESPRVGVFVGAMWNDYQSHGVEVWAGQGRVEEFSHHASLANRISYLFDFSGPSVAINTSCSSAMTALHLACESIRRGECDAAVVGGVNLVSHAYHARLLETIDFLSKEEACRPFSAQANGWVLGEGVGAVLLKPVDAAVRGRDHVYAVVRGSAIGHSGRTMRFGAPSAQRQERTIREALAHAGLAPDDIDYVEAAASGAGMADAVEMSAVKAVFAGRRADAPCRVGTVKANVGHLESASVLSQLTKVLYQLRHRLLAPSLNSRPRNPLIALDGSGLSIVEELTPWSPAEAGTPLRALINVVGAAGSEGHLVLEEYPSGRRSPAPRAPAIVPVSAATAAQLRQQVQDLLQFVERAPDTSLADLAFTLQVGRVGMAERLAFVVPDLGGLRDALAACLAADGLGGTARPDTWRGRAERGAEAAPAGADLAALARHFVCGGAIDWHALPRGDAQRISLPTYPFEQVSHWIGRAAATDTADAVPPAKEQGRADAQSGAQLRERILAHLLRLVAGVTEVPVARLDADAPLEGYGLTSLMIQALNGKLEEAFGPLSKTLLFEVRTLRQLAEHFYAYHGEAAGRRFGAAPAAPPQRAAAQSRGGIALSAAPQAGDGIAIVGLSGRYPKANTLRAFWANLSQGVDCIGEIPPERWQHGRYYDSARGKPGKTYSKWGGFIDGVGEFDPMFFGMTPREAALIDPQERLFLQTAWHAVEDAGYTRAGLRSVLGRRVGVFVGVMYGEYQLYPSLPGGLATSATYGTIANRVSYVLDLCGPSMAVDTLCSSSLTALHLACESIRRGECAAAIAGGVSLSLHPNKYATQALLGMAASDGRCRSFGEGGDGFVPGEGVGAVLLKPLAQAIADGDHIYGVIKGTAVNHGGRTNGFTVPDPRAQAELIRTALSNAGVAPQAVSYIEAHGTGTALGDPIEIAGLVQAFGAPCDAAPHCAIGSAKSNIGHCEAAAGIAGLTKVLLQMQHRTLVKNLHCEQLNPNIDFSRTPFAVQTATAPWPRPLVPGDDGPRESARIAGISSFGAGGANAHIIVEEYEAPARSAVAVTAERPVAIVLSAKTAEALREQAGQLRDAIAAGELGDERLADAAYTLQVGREAMECRLACLAESAAALGARLDAWLGGARDVDGLLLAETQRSKHALAAFTADEDMAQAIDAWIAKGKLAKLLELWVNGLAFDWNRLYQADGADKPQRISLAPYPFAREHYWVQAPPADVPGSEGAGMGALHPLVQRNTSDLLEQRYSSHLSGVEFCVAGHVLHGRPVLAAAAYLEMAREALAQAGAVEAGAALRLLDVAWQKPLPAPAQVHIGLYPEADGRIAVEIYSGEDEVHCVAVAEAMAAEAAQALDLDALRARCGQSVQSGADCYARLAAQGLAYGPALQAIESVYSGDGLLLARLQLPASAVASEADYGLHPSLLEALWPAAALLAGEPGAAVPSGADRVEISGRCSPQMWAVVQAHAGDAAQRFDVALCDDRGVVCVRFQGLALAAAESRAGEGGVLLLRPEWQDKAAAVTIAPDYQRQVVMLCGVGVAAPALRERGGAIDYTECEAGENLAADFSQAVQQLCGALRELLQAVPAGPLLVQVVVPADGPRQPLAALAGVLRCARREQPGLVGQLIAVGEGESDVSLAAKLRENASCPEATQIRYLDGQRQVAAWRELAAEPDALIPWKRDGVYLITGGLGGLGRVFAGEIAQRAPGATLVLTGRRALDNAGREQLRTLEAAGAKVAYHAVDVADRAAVSQLLRQVREAHGGLHGIVHAAGVFEEGFLLRKSAARIGAVLAPKVTGLVNLDEASREFDLDYLICFSSISVLGSPGLADYAAGNGFMDAYVHHRNALAAQGLRKGRAVALNWPSWKAGGMPLDAAGERWIEQRTGLQALATQAGIGALYRVLGAGLAQAMALQGNAERIRRQFLDRLDAAAPAAVATAPAPAALAPVVEAGASRLQDRAVHYFTKLLASVFKLPMARLEADAPLERYGIDSILVTQLTLELERAFGALPKTLFFEYQTIAALTGYFLAQHRARLVELLGGEQTAPTGVLPAAAQPPARPPQPAVPVRARRRFAAAQAAGADARSAPARQDIAIVGVAGRYPQARDLQALWASLRNGEDHITEVPPERWDHSRYFDPDKNRAGSTYAKWGGFIDGVDEFDAQFFGISPREAEVMDPQERLFLECVYAVLEDAGYTRETLGQQTGGKVGVYAGVGIEEYKLFGAELQARGHHIGVSGSPASIANRVSYFCNFHGPSMMIDTMCSASLTALHLACESLRNGSCAAAIAGGVNLNIHPNKYLLLAQGKFASSKGRCESFGEGGDGYVPAEGVGAVLLKPLEQAIADGDHVYAVIKAVTVNHGGKTNGYTVPNPHAQADVVARALREAGVDPRTVSYLEAHGTGTSLGDPIEIAGLSKAFGASTQDRQFCAIGSIKSNIGHCEAAAGIAGITKVLLQLKHGELVPSLHAETLNPHIDFAATPFVVQRQLAVWRRPVVEVDGRSVEFPRRAGVSAFGAGGANAHVVIEEYLAPQPAEAVQPGGAQPALVVLSARNAERLQERVRQLLAAVADEDCGDALLADLAYTLQVGREAMDERLALQVCSMAGLREKLRAYLAGDEGIEDLYSGQVKRNKEALAAFTADEDLAGAVDAWIAKGKLHKLLDLWVKGLAFDWNKLPGAQKRRRVSLPTYPFARERHWVPLPEGQADAQAAAQPAPSALLHPLVHRNTSRMGEQRFSSRLSGNEFFLAEHVVQGKRVLPGVAYLEMAREALVQAEAFETAASGVRLRNVVWSRPVIVDDAPVDVHIGLYAEADGRIGYEVYSGEGDVHSQGLAEAVGSAPERLDLGALQEQCNQALLAGDACYAGFATIGLAYGQAFQAIARIHVGQGQVLARLELPEGAASTASGFVLHPGLLDAALQAVVGLADPQQKAELVLPFGVESVEIVGRCSPRMWALVKASGDSTAQVRKYDVTLCDDEGVVAVRLLGFAARVVEGQLGAGSVLLLRPEWRRQAAQGAAPQYQERHAVLCGVGVAAPALQERMDGASCVELAAGNDLAADYGTAVQRLCAAVQAILQGKPAGPVLLQVVVPAEGPRQALAGLAGLLRTARQEQPKLVGQLIAVGSGVDADALAAMLAANAACPQDVLIRHVDGQREVADWEEMTAEAAAPPPWKADGVYLLTGGLGGLGQLFAREIARRARGVTLVLTGRRELDDAGRQHVRALEALGATVAYRALDVADGKAVRQLVLQVREEYQGLHGIVHAAGVLRDSLLLKKTPEEVDAVLAPKVAGLLHLDEASRDVELDWLICFSSTSAALGNAGQADYAAANGFLDSYAHYRNGLAAQGLRHGRTVSLNWPLWKEGGMRMDAASEARIAQLTGLTALASEAGIEALYGVLGAGVGQAMVLQGAPGKLRQRLLAQPKPAFLADADGVAAAGATAQADVDANQLQERISRVLKDAVSALLKVKAEDIDGDAELSEFGFDSVTLTEFGNRLNQDYQLALTPTIFFEHPTLNSFAAYLRMEQGAVFAARLMGAAQALPAPAPAAAAMAMARPGRRHAAPAAAVPVPAPAREAIAIIGMSGCFPMAHDLGEFWDNLLAKKDCISEIPASRWDWRKIYGDPATEENTSNVKWGGFIDGVDEFDPLFFGISPKEAEVIDPQQRLLMTHVWKAIEDAGYAAGSLSGSRTALYVGTGATGYGSLLARAKLPIEGYSATGVVPSVGPNRMSYLLNLHGPSEPVETACSSSLVALRKGVMAIENGGCELAIVGGINTLVTPEAHISFSKAGMLCEDGRCKTFSAQANGYVRGEGVGMLVLKRLSAAERDGDHIYGLIRGTAENHGGRATSLTAPNPKAQADLLKEAYQAAGVDPRSVGYIEAHGTGTPLGDPIEVNGLKMAFKALYQDAGAAAPDAPHCALGSVKSNIGHLELAAGVAGVIKVLLQLRHKTLVGSLHCDEVNPYIDLRDSPFYLVRQSGEWPALRDGRGRELPRRAGVSSFGFGGVNAHVVIEEYVGVADTRPPTPDGAALVLLSAKNAERLQEQAQQLLAAIEANGWGDDRLAELAYTLQVGREAMEERLALVVDSMAQLKERLAAFVAGQSGIADLFRGQVKRNKEALAVFSADEELQEAIAKWVARKKFGKVLDLWVKGLVFDWKALYGEYRPKRMGLPSYPFARERYWVPETDGHLPAVRKAQASFDEAYYMALLDRVMEGSVSVESAVQDIDAQSD
ncbi:amino acid adenylation domain-containing protein [Janthinobacterium fluminis]|uniref:Amino acid adenylation domain-containing protein n=1 Tax=Janthinobacterium fluminis TaxID=2987524 RepID=A0ABT5K160_9BURK|nr:amino acid adenylation domain-containing protein [Janthinobacterium fluminis]MDC8758415.1 amino acid adenylation domain-containing protein [Janthinobacterium fluminis]